MGKVQGLGGGGGGGRPRIRGWEGEGGGRDRRSWASRAGRWRPPLPPPPADKHAHKASPAARRESGRFGCRRSPAGVETFEVQADGRPPAAGRRPPAALVAGSRTRSETLTHARTHARMHAHTITHTHNHTHKKKNMHMHMHTHAHAHAHTQRQRCACLRVLVRQPGGRMPHPQCSEYCITSAAQLRLLPHPG